MSLELSRARAREASAGLPVVGSEVLRAEAVKFCAKVPEPPVYLRRDDPARALAASLIPEGEALLARAYRAGDRRWGDALEAWLDTLHHIRDGKVERAEASWVEALRLEQVANGSRRLYAASDEAPPPVFDPSTGVSRYDPRPERTLTLKVPCPSCRKLSEVTVSGRVAQHGVTCQHCKAQFVAYVCEVRSVEVQQRGARRHYTFRLTELGGAHTRLEVEDASVDALPVVRLDLLAFLYLPASNLRGVLNLSSSRVLWLTSGGPCFVATVAFGEGAAELDVLRQFRDRVLARSTPGRAFIWGYYAVGPALAEEVSKRRWLKSATAKALRVVVQAIVEASP